MGDVFVLEGRIDYEVGYVLGVFSALELATACVFGTMKDDTLYDAFAVTRWSVDARGAVEVWRAAHADRDDYGSPLVEVPPEND